MKILTFIITFFLFTSTASACGYGEFKFGKSIDDLAEKYGIEEDFEDDEEQQIEIPVRGRSICPELGSGIIGKLVFVKDQLVQMKFKREGQGTKLLDFAEKKFGKVQRPSSLSGSKPKMQHIWDKKGKPLIMYSVSQRKNGTIEHIDITSRDHKELIDFANNEREKEINGRSEISR